MSDGMGDAFGAQLRAAKAEGELECIKDALRDFAEENGFNPEMEPRELLAKATGAFRSCSAMSDARYTEIQKLREDVEAMRPRLMPEGMEWPRYEDGEPVRFGDVVGDVKVRSVVLREDGVILSNCTSVPGWGTWRSCKEPIKRPAPEALDADGVEIREGDTVWCVATDEQLLDMSVSIIRGLNRGRELTVTGVTQRGGEPWARFEQTGFLIKACYLTHAEPEQDSWERIEEDLPKSYAEYWGCVGVGCSSCPAEIDGKKPHERLDGCSHNCLLAMRRDIVRRCKALAGEDS